MVHAGNCVAAAFRVVRVVGRRQCSRSKAGLVLFGSGAGLPGSSVGLRPSLKSLVRVNYLSCCAKVDLPPPREIIVEYQEKPENTDYFIQLADGIENANPELMVLGNPDDMQPREGSFEVTAGEHVLFSKLQAKRLPRVEEILLALDQLPTEALSCEVGTDDKAATA